MPPKDQKSPLKGLPASPFSGFPGFFRSRPVSTGGVGSHSSFWFYLALLIISLGAIPVVLASTRTGTATSPDTWTYLATARNLQAGHGFYITDTRAYVQWTPLYPVLLAILYSISDLLHADIHVLKVLRWSNALTFGATVFLSAYFFRQYIRSRALVLVAAVWVMVSAPILVVSAYAWADLLLVPLTLLFMIVLKNVLETPTPRALAALIGLAALAPLQRHSGVFLIGAGAVSIALWMRASSFHSRLKWAGWFSLGAGTPFAIWLVRCYLVSDSLAGYRGEPLASLRTNIRRCIETPARWFIPRETGIGYFELTAAAILVIAVLLALGYRRGSFTPGGLRKSMEKHGSLLAMLLIIALHMLILISSATFTFIMPIDDRYMAPIYILIVGLFFMVLDQVQQWINRRFPSRIADYALPALAALWLIVPTDHLKSQFTLLQTISEASNATYDSWRDSDLIRQIKAHPPQGNIFTNAPTHVLVQTGITNHRVPRALNGWTAPDGVLSPSRTNLLIWFDPLHRCDFERGYCVATSYEIGDLHTILEVQPEITASDGGVYRLAGAP